MGFLKVVAFGPLLFGLKMRLIPVPLKLPLNADNTPSGGGGVAAATAAAAGVP